MTSVASASTRAPATPGRTSAASDRHRHVAGSATFTNETGTGWQEVTFSNPVPISANTTYVASYCLTGGLG